ncbi:hypothetical protein TTHERM_000521999 (macronuclear) [Tetrahymena thermophila SB210]|uniref:Uncharacterized protein n=1 Tax=Tetrahymena thermophila (strain SB210) TaxID=312017 RepID=W7XBG1_TETTS|nr:hypothetical protein TTHERM_000521999 [Tetrahymena thermophila SB210]EWS74677.1 hypothetical protein TTHERM_000521999 [Tetrahymena thermophila SB210]|eukprot:XP_012652767.1 hypothetical protein TTHERM_000521999 [Tetrahymena thermophila SB210]
MFPDQKIIIQSANQQYKLFSSITMQFFLQTQDSFLLYHFIEFNLQSQQKTYLTVLQLINDAIQKNDWWSAYQLYIVQPLLINTKEKSKLQKASVYQFKKKYFQKLNLIELNNFQNTKRIFQLISIFVTFYELIKNNLLNFQFFKIFTLVHNSLNSQKQ